MSMEQITVALPRDVWQSAERIADRLDASLSAVVATALVEWVRPRLVDSWLVEYELAHGAFGEE
ncbi:hypothetical protein BH24ACT9_BH24ACT9_11960 [soil metagenome]